MPHNNGRIFTHTESGTKYGVSVGDVQQTLRRGTGDVGLLCSDQEWVGIPYQRVEYLESTGTQYIDTGVALGSNFKVELDFKCVDAASVEQPFLSTWVSSKNYFNFFVQPTSNRIDLYVTAHYYFGEVSINTIYSATIERNGDDWSATCNGTTHDFTKVLSDNPTTIKLFKRGDISTQYCYGRIYRVKVWDNESLVLDLFPVRVGNVGYMYDTVSGQLFGNSGSGSFVLGEDVDSHILGPVNRINKWAKYRPIEKAGVRTILTDAQRSAENWGIGNIPKWTNKTIPAMTKFWIGGTGSTGSTPPDCGIQFEYWTRILPSTLFRLHDFASTVDDKGYWHGAEAPISPFEGELAIPSTGQLDVIYRRGIENNETILLSDFGDFSTFFFGVIFANADFSLIYLVTQEYAMGSPSWPQDFAVHIQGANVLVPTGTSATWRLFPVLINVQSAFTTLTDMNSSSDEYTIVALLDYVDAVITTGGVDYTFLAESATHSPNTKFVSFSFYFKNNETTTGLQKVRVAVEYKTQLGEVIATGTADVQCTGQTAGTVPADTYGHATGSHAFDTNSIADSIYSVVGHVDRIEGRDYTIVWREAVVNAITPD